MDFFYTGWLAAAIVSTVSETRVLVQLHNGTEIEYPSYLLEKAETAPVTLTFLPQPNNDMFPIFEGQTIYDNQSMEVFMFRFDGDELQLFCKPRLTPANWYPRSLVAWREWPKPPPTVTAEPEKPPGMSSVSTLGLGALTVGLFVVLFHLDT